MSYVEPLWTMIPLEHRQCAESPMRLTQWEVKVNANRHPDFATCPACKTRLYFGQAIQDGGDDISRDPGIAPPLSRPLFFPWLPVVK
jgi:hypothetical protein